MMTQLDDTSDCSARKATSISNRCIIKKCNNMGYLSSWGMCRHQQPSTGISSSATSGISSSSVTPSYQRSTSSIIPDISEDGIDKLSE